MPFPWMALATLFQFYKSTIITGVFPLCFSLIPQFQFYKSTIITVMLNLAKEDESKISILQKYDYNIHLLKNPAPFTLFQFYKSTIITCLKRLPSVNNPEFQFYKSTIITPLF